MRCVINLIGRIISSACIAAGAVVGMAFGGELWEQKIKPIVKKQSKKD